MVGPAPERHIPRRPGCDIGVTDARMSGSPGICRQEPSGSEPVLLSDMDS